MRAPTPKTRAAWPLLLAALGVLLGLALSRPASASDACSREATSAALSSARRPAIVPARRPAIVPAPRPAIALAHQLIGVTAALALHEEVRGPVARGPVVAGEREARLVDLDHGQWIERSSGRDPHASPDASGAHRREGGAPPPDAALHPRWPGPDLGCSVAAAVVNRVARTSEARRDARVRSVHASRGPPKPLARG